jgi:flagellar M-ring protein FliF
MADSLNWFKAWPTGRKVGFGFGLLVIMLSMVALGLWAYRTPKAVLFADLAERDVAVMVGELDKLKQPYDIGADGRSILVASDKVHHTRMSLMGKQLPLNGVVGFELFNNADFGVSDFVQKVNYQRALQGELTRTILALDQVQDARVHLALPEQSVFKREVNAAKASVTLSLKPGLQLQPNQVAGIQRLVAASVPEVRVDDVAVLDQNGVVLSRATGDDTAAVGAQLDAKQSIEAHLTKKATGLLAQWFGPGEALVAVDVVLNHQQSKVTTEEVLPTQTGSRQATGVVTRQRTTSREQQVQIANSGEEPAQLVSQETDYQVGRRTEQTVSQGAQVSRINLAVVVRRSMSEADLQRLRQVLATAVGLQPSRGDALAVQTLGDMALAPLQAPALESAGAGKPAEGTVKTPMGKAQQDLVKPDSQRMLWALGALVVLALLAAVVLSWRQRQVAKPKPLSEAEREALLRAVQQWLEPSSRIA